MSRVFEGDTEFLAIAREYDSAPRRFGEIGAKSAEDLEGLLRFVDGIKGLKYPFVSSSELILSVTRGSAVQAARAPLVVVGLDVGNARIGLSCETGQACDALGIPRCSTNDLRRSYASWLGQAGVRDELIEKALGHKGSSVLGRHYRKLTDDDLLRLMLEDLRKEGVDLRKEPDAPEDLRTTPNGPSDSPGGPTRTRTGDRRIKNPQL